MHAQSIERRYRRKEKQKFSIVATKLTGLLTDRTLLGKPQPWFAFTYSLSFSSLLQEVGEGDGQGRGGRRKHYEANSWAGTEQCPQTCSKFLINYFFKFEGQVGQMRNEKQNLHQNQLILGLGQLIFLDH